MKQPRRILVVLESRSTYGYSKSVIDAIKDARGLELQTLITGMHFVPELGMTIDMIRADGLEISATAETGAPDDSPASWSRALGSGIATAADAMERLKPDIVLVFGDRMETVSVTLAAVYMGLIVAHVQAGDKSGHIDDAARMAMAKLVHIHFASCDDSVERLEKIGEQPFRIHKVGAPQLDLIIHRLFEANQIEAEGKSFNLSSPYILFVHHPLMTEHDKAGLEYEMILKCALTFELPVICIAPNSDLGFRSILDVINKYTENSLVTSFMNLPRDAFLSALANCSVLIGNSSAGILEAPSLRVPVVNIGERQRGRPQATNIINAASDEVEIYKAIETALQDKAFRKATKQAVNVYGDGHSADRIVNVLSYMPINNSLRDKITTY